MVIKFLYTRPSKGFSYLESHEQIYLGEFYHIFINLINTTSER